MGFRDDTRGVSPVVGFVLIFGLLVLLLGNYQLLLVPDLNKQVEAGHADRVGEDFTELRNTIQTVSQNDEERSMNYELGFTYPIRPLAVNPPPVSGEMRTSESTRDIVFDGSVSGSRAGSSTEGVCEGPGSGSVIGTAAETRFLTYRANYNERSSEPLHVYENTVAYREFEDGTRINDTKQRLVKGNQINLLPVGPSRTFSQSSAGTTSLDVTSNDNVRSNVSVESGDTFTLEFPSRIPADSSVTGVSSDDLTWEDLLAEQIGSNEPIPSDGVSQLGPLADNRVEIEFNEGEYVINCHSMGLNQEPPNPENPPRINRFQVTTDNSICEPPENIVIDPTQIPSLNSPVTVANECEAVDLAEYRIDWQVSDPDGDLRGVAIALDDTDTGDSSTYEKKIEINATVEGGALVNGTTTIRLRRSGVEDANGNEYDIEMFVEDRRASSSSPSPTAIEGLCKPGAANGQDGDDGQSASGSCEGLGPNG